MVATSLQVIWNEAPNGTKNGHDSGYQKNDIVECSLPKRDGACKKSAIAK